MCQGSDAIRNFGIIAHIDAGKTTLTEAILHATGALRIRGAVDEGNTVSDYLLQERERGISIVSAAVTCSWRKWQYNMVDTPGHIDFTGEVERSLRVMDAVVAVFCAVHGVQAQSEMVWRRARRYRLPALAFVNKLDREGADFGRTLKGIAALAAPAQPVVLAKPLLSPAGSLLGVLDFLSGVFDALDGVEAPPAAELSAQLAAGRAELLERLSGLDDSLLADYVDGRCIGPERLAQSLRSCLLEGRAVGVLAGSAHRALGVSGLLDAIGALLPSPAQRLLSPGGRSCINLPLRTLNRPEGGAYVSAAVIKVVRSEWRGDYAAVRIYSGRVHSGVRLSDSAGRCGFEVGAVWRLNAGDVSVLESAADGEIVGISPASGEELPPLYAGDTLLEAGAPRFRLARMAFPEPVISTLLKGVSPEDEARLLPALKALAEGDPTLKVRRDRESGRVRLWGLGELHLEIAAERLKSDFGVRVSASSPLVAYRTAVAKSAVADYEFVRQLAPLAPLSARIKVSVEPLPRGSGLQLDFPYREGKGVPERLWEPIEKVLDEIVGAGGSSGYPLTDTRVTLLAGSTTMAEPSEPAFLTAVRMAMDEVFARAGLTVLEPVTRLEVDTPRNLTGAVIADLNARSAKILKVDSAESGCARIVAQVPLSELFSYATDLRSLSCGRAEFSAGPAGYEVRHAPAQKTR